MEMNADTQALRARIAALTEQLRAAREALKQQARQKPDAIMQKIHAEHRRRSRPPGFAGQWKK